jgi:hypothetical protein
MVLLWGITKLTQKFNAELLQAEAEKLFNSAMEAYEEEHNTEEAYEELIDEISEEVKIGSLTYSAGRTLKEIDPIAFRCGMADESDRFYEEFEEENSIEDFEEEALQNLNMEAAN